MHTKALLASSFVLLGGSVEADAGVIYATNFSELDSAIDTANLSPGSTIYLAPGIYTGGELPNILATLTIALDPSFGAAPGSAVLNTTPTGSKGILTIPSTVSDVSLTVDGLTFQNAAISASDGGNGAGIRDQSLGPAFLNVMNSIFLNNQDGILTGHGGLNEQLVVNISNSLFANNGAPDGFEHGIYIFGQSLEVTGSTFCGTIGGHDIKSRTAVTTITGSVLYDGALNPNNAICGIGSTSYAVDLPNGGQGILDNDQFIQGPATENFAIVSYGEEGLTYASNSLEVSGDTFTSTVAGRGIQELSNGVPTCLIPVQLSSTTFSPLLTPVVPGNCVGGPVTEPGVPISEPGIWWMMIAGFAGLAAWRFRRPRMRYFSVRA